MTKQAYMFGDQPPKDKSINTVLKAVQDLYNVYTDKKLYRQDGTVTMAGEYAIEAVVDAWDDMLG